MTAMARAGISRSIIPSRLNGLYDHRRALATPDAGRAEAVTPAAAAEGVQQVQGDPRAAGAKRVPERHRTSVYIRALAIESQLLLDREVLRGEGLVDLHEIHLLQVEPRCSERAPRGRHRSNAHDCGVHTGRGPGHES